MRALFCGCSAERHSVMWCMVDGLSLLPGFVDDPELIADMCERDRQNHLAFNCAITAACDQIQAWKDEQS